MKYQVAMLTAAMVTATLGANAGRDRQTEPSQTAANEARIELDAATAAASEPDETGFRPTDFLAYNELPANHDRAIALAATHRLALNAAMRLNPVQVECEAGVVRLSGHVPAPYYCTLAENLVRKVSGVYEVQNDLIVDGVDPYARTDSASKTTWEEEITEKALAYDLAVVRTLDLV